MKWLILLFSIVKPFLSSGNSESAMLNPIKELKEMIRENAAKVVLLFSAASALATIFAAGIVIIAVDVGAQYDQTSYIYFSTMIIMGLILVFIPVIIGAASYIVFTNEERQGKIKEREVLVSVGTSHPLQDALALLIHDFVKEREAKRAEESQASRTSNHPERTETSTHHTSERIHPEGLHRH